MIIGFYIFIAVGILFLGTVWFCVFFDQAVLTRRGTVYRVKNDEKRIALTFDDGPSPIWTGKILEELEKADVKATFFMTGRHVKHYPEVAKNVANQGHEIENHGYAHNVLLYYRPEEIEEEIKYTEYIIKDITGQTTKYFRPPKAWLSPRIKSTIKEMGYNVVLWSLNSKDWVTFDAKSIARSVSKKIRNGDILLFHDSGGVFKAEGGDRSQTVSAIPILVRELQKKGFQFVTVDQLIRGNGRA